MTWQANSGATVGVARLSSAVLIAVSCSVIALACAAQAQTFQTIAVLGGAQGGEPRYTSLAQALDGKFYATASMLGLWGEGTVFKVTPDGTLADIYNFCNRTSCSTGIGPQAGLVLATDGYLYGTAQYGGDLTCNCGTIFKITPAGHLTVLHTFMSSDGAYPSAPLIEAPDGNFYGTTRQGGACGLGTVFKMTPSGTLTTLHSFDEFDGQTPVASLLLATDGNFYGATPYGGDTNQCTVGCGAIFKMTPNGALTTLHKFHNFNDSATPYAALIQATDGNLYGTTVGSGGSNSCQSKCGTVFRITLKGQLTTLHTFTGYPVDGNESTAPLIQATDGNFYGTTVAGGNGSACNGCGTIFEVTSNGTLTILHNFDYYNDGDGPTGGLIQGTDGVLYGTTTYGPGTLNGTIFSLNVGLFPFVSTLPSFGKAGAVIKVLGSNLTGATSVSFNGTPARFTVVSPTLIKTTVPTGATTGTVQVMTPAGTLTSNTAFRVN